MISNPTIRNPQSAILSPVYFPFTFIAPSLVEALSVCFDRVIVYRPVGSTLVEGLQQWVTQGLLEIRIPFQDVIDEKALSDQLKNYRTWGALNQGADLAYMKEAGDQIALIDPWIPRTVSEIKGRAGKTREKPKNRDLALQLFLHLAQDFDEQSWELQEQLDRFKLQQQALQDFFRIDRPEETEDVVSSAPFPGPSQDGGSFMLENRMFGWRHLFQKDHDASSLLFTDSPVAHAWLLEAAQEKIEVVRFSVPCTEPTADCPPWKDPLQKLFHALLTTPWSEKLQQRTEQATGEIVEIIETWKESIIRPSDKNVSFHWSVVPNQPADSLLNQRCGLEIASGGAGRSENTIIGLVEP